MNATNAGPTTKPPLEHHEAMHILGDVAAPAIASIRKSELADKLEVMEQAFAEHFRQVRAQLGGDGFLGWLVNSWLGKKFTTMAVEHEHAVRALRISRAELRELGLAFTKAASSQNAAAIQGDLNAQFMRLGGDLNDLYHFLFDHFGEELAAAQAENKKLIDVAKAIMIRQKMALAEKK